MHRALLVILPLILAIVAPSGCSTSDPTSSAPGPSPSTTAEQTIGSAGGSVRIGGMTLHVPPGALEQDVRITITASDETIAGFDLFSPVFRCAPDGLVFKQPATVKIAFTGERARAAMFWTRAGSTRAFDRIDGSVGAGELVASISHFSGGFVGAPASAPTDAGDEEAPITCSDTQSDPKNCGGCGHDCLGAGCVAGLCTPTEVVGHFVSGFPPRQLASDGTTLYWLERQQSSGVLASIVLDGSTTTPTKLTDTFASTALLVDSTNVFWATIDTLQTIPARTRLNSIAKAGGTAVQVGPTGALTSSLASDGTNLYYGQDGEIMKVPIAGGTPTPVTSGARVGLFAYDAGSFYWIDSSTLEAQYPNKPKPDGAVKKLEAGTQTTLVSTLTTWRGGLPLAIDDQYVYWTNADALAGVTAPLIQRVPRAGGPITTVAPNDTEWYAASSLTVVEGYLYWQGGQYGDAFRVSKGGGAPERLTKDSSSPRATFAIAGPWLYFNGANSKIYKVAR